VLAPVPSKRNDGGSSFATLGKYLTEKVNANTGEIINRGEVMISPALLSEATATAEMKAVAAENTRCKDAVMHLVLSWKEGENPTSEQWQGAVKHTMDSLKDRDGISMGEHQYMAVAHRDTENFHIHIMVNRVHPETYRANSPEWLHKTLDKACREIEAAQGWQHSNGLYKWDEEKGKAVALTRDEREELRDRTHKQPKEIIEENTNDRRERGRLDSANNGIDGLTTTRDNSGRAVAFIPGGGLPGKPNIGRVGRKPPPQNKNRLRNLSELGVVRLDNGSEVLLPGDVHDFMEQQRTKSDDGLRRDLLGTGLNPSTAGSGKASKMETYGNVESLETYCKGQPAKDVSQLLKRDGINWQDVHSTLLKHGLELHKSDKGGYTVSANGANGEQIHVKASKVFRGQFAGKKERAATDEKLGQWEAPKEFLQHVIKKEKVYNPHREPRRNPQDREEQLNERAKLREDLKARYKEHKTQQVLKLRQHQKAEQDSVKEKFKELSKVARERRAAIKAIRVAPEVRKALLSVAAAEAVRAKDTLRAELAEKRKKNNSGDYRTWVTERAKEGDMAAISQIRGWQYQEGRNAKEIERRNAELDKLNGAGTTDSSRHDPADPRGFADAKKSAALRMTWNVDTKTGDVAYQIDGKQAFTDHGERVSFAADKDADAMEAGLKLAAQKYGGTVKINGTDEFKKRAVEVAAERGISITFANKELSIYHEACKRQIQVERETRGQRREQIQTQIQEPGRDNQQKVSPQHQPKPRKPSGPRR